MELRSLCGRQAPRNALTALEFQLRARVSANGRRHTNTQPPIRPEKTIASLAKIPKVSKPVSPTKNISSISSVGVLQYCQHRPFSSTSKEAFEASPYSSIPPKPVQPSKQSNLKPAPSPLPAASAKGLELLYQPIRRLRHFQKPDPKFSGKLQPRYIYSPRWKRKTVVYVPEEVLEIEKSYDRTKSLQSEMDSARSGHVSKHSETFKLPKGAIAPRTASDHRDIEQKHRPGRADRNLEFAKPEAQLDRFSKLLLMLIVTLVTLSISSEGSKRWMNRTRNSRGKDTEVEPGDLSNQLLEAEGREKEKMLDLGDLDMREVHIEKGPRFDMKEVDNERRSIFEGI